MPTQLLTLPARLKTLYEQSPHRAAADLAQQSFLPWLDHFGTNLPFFPEYTDHGRNHLQSVLASADALIPQVVFTQNLLTPDDAVLLVLATLLHDAAMALTEDQFIALVVPSPGIANLPIGSSSSAYPLTAPSLDPAHPEKEKHFPELFDDFFAEARRWDGRKLANILGTLAPDEKADYPDFLKHPKDLGPTTIWTQRHRRLYGEFIRQHHPRLAHHFALHGLPAVTRASCPPPSLPEGLPPYLKDLTGLIARSHGIALRDTFPYFSRFGKNKRAVTHNAHPIYLMALLRIADFLQFDHARDTDLSHVRRLHSPLSQLNWQSHAALEDTTWDTEDSEALNFTANPPDAKTYLFIQDILRGPHGLQQELDTAWAVLGEVFSKQTSPINISQFAFTVRRVTSNIDNPKEFLRAHNPNFFPYAAKFDTAGADLLKLLIRPLYGDHAEYGVRELLQNSLDAVAELEHFCDMRRIDRDTLRKRIAPQEIEVSILHHTNGHYVLTISDNGIGMTEETVRNYFLTVGASFRTSDAWTREFGKEPMKNAVLRSGRFGVGVLAIFLLGSEFTLTTRHIEAAETEGVRLKATLEDETRELQRIREPRIGTQISVTLSPHAAKRLTGANPLEDRDKSEAFARWDWFSLNHPIVRRYFEDTVLSQKEVLPPPTEGVLSDGWSRLATSNYRDLQWKSESRPRLFCNGIEVRSPRKQSKAADWPTDLITPLRFPSISIFDPTGALPLTLTRDGLQTRDLDFSMALHQEIAHTLISFLLVYAPTSPDYFMKPFPEPIHKWSRLLIKSGCKFERFLFAQVADGSVFCTASAIAAAGIQHVLLCKPGHVLNPAQLLKNHTVDGIIYDQRTNGSELDLFLGHGIRPNVELMRFFWPYPSRSGPEIASWCKNRQFDKIDAPGGWHVSQARILPNLIPIPISDLASIFIPSRSSHDPIVEWQLKHPEGHGTSEFVESLGRFMPDPIIPYDVAARKTKFAYAYERLAPLVARWEACRLA